MNFDHLLQLKSIVNEEQLFQIMKDDGFKDEEIADALNSLRITESQAQVAPSPMNDNHNIDISHKAEHNLLSSHISHLRTFMSDGDIKDLLISEGYDIGHIDEYLIVLPCESNDPEYVIEVPSVKSSSYMYDIYLYSLNELSQEGIYAIEAIYQRMKRFGYKCYHSLSNISSTSSSSFNKNKSNNIKKTTKISLFNSDVSTSSKVLMIFLGNCYQKSSIEACNSNNNDIEKNSNDNENNESSFNNDNNQQNSLQLISDFWVQQNKPIIFITLDSTEKCETYLQNLCLSDYQKKSSLAQTEIIPIDYMNKFMHYFKKYSVDVSCFINNLTSGNILNLWTECSSDKETNDKMAQYLLNLYQSLDLVRLHLKLFKCTPSLTVIIYNDSENNQT